MINGIDYLKRMYPNQDDKDYQPSGMDLRLGAVYKINEDNVCGIINGNKNVPMHIEVKPQDFPDFGYKNSWKIEPNRTYIFEVENQIQIGNHNAQFYLPRSTLLRCGVNVYTALGDLGYNGHLSFLVINHRQNDFYISKGERFAQLVDFEVRGGSESYDGDYQEKKESWLKD